MAIKSFSAIFEKGKVVHEYRFRHKDGPYKWVRDELTLFSDSEGNPMEFVGSWMDITERKQAEMEHYKNEKHAQAAIEAARGITFSYNINTGKVTWGGSIEEITGIPREEFEKVDIDGWAERIHPEDRDQTLSVLNDAIQKVDRATAEYRFRTDNGYVNIYSVSLTQRLNGVPIRLIGIMQDITERKKTEEALAWSEESARGLLNAMADIALLLEADGTILAMNKVAAGRLGKDERELLGTCVYDAIPRPMSEMRKGKAAKVIRTAQDVTYIEERNGNYWESSIFPIIDKHGTVARLAVYARNITEQKKAEKDRKRLEKELLEGKEKLSEKNFMLEQKNAALSELMNQVRAEKERIEDRTRTNVDCLLRPLLLRLRGKGSHLDNSLIDLLEENLVSLTSSFGEKLLDLEKRLTPREIEICNMIKGGLTSKEIGGLLSISPRSVESHRNNIRKKLRIANKGITLHSYLQKM